MRDLYSECKTPEITDEQMRGHCARCVNPECERAFKTNSFEKRAKTWEARLFNAQELPRADPRFLKIAGQKFETVVRPVQVQVPASWHKKMHLTSRAWC
jgi:hypothetical protein